MRGSKSHCNPLGVQPSCSLFNVRSQSTRVPVLPDFDGLNKLGRKKKEISSDLFSFPNFFLAPLNIGDKVLHYKYWVLGRLHLNFKKAIPFFCLKSEFKEKKWKKRKRKERKRKSEKRKKRRQKYNARDSNKR